jgi:hypothetical protein
MKKEKLYLVLLFFLLSISTFSQKNTDRSASFMHYGLYIQPFIEIHHNYFYKGELDSLKEDFFIEISFNIDTNGRIINYRIKNENYPAIVKKYIKDLIYSTNNKWLPEIKNCIPQISETIICYFFMYSKKITISERMENRQKEFHKNYLDTSLKEPPPHPEFNKPNTCFIFLKY